MGDRIKGLEDGNLSDPDGQVVRGRERERNERGIWIEGAIIEFRRNLVPENLPGSHKDDLS